MLIICLVWSTNRIQYADYFIFSFYLFDFYQSILSQHIVLFPLQTELFWAPLFFSKSSIVLERQTRFQTSNFHRHWVLTFYMRSVSGSDVDKVKKE